MGDNFWGFMDSGVVPDIVTMGKPIGDGHPLAVVVTTPAIAEAFAKETHYFNTFGGNPVSATAGKAVLEVVARDNLGVDLSKPDFWSESIDLIENDLRIFLESAPP